MLNGTTIEVTYDGEIETHPFEVGRCVRIGANGEPVICTDGEPPFGIVSRGGRWPQVTIIGIETQALVKVGAMGIRSGDRLTSDGDGFARLSAGADAFAVALMDGGPGALVRCRFIVTPADEIADDE